eukprot:GILK01008097.1.p1 GENE.GILK01008097.1~~GILK01008097.1.p1  ORF type:complete len:819 (+),score=178.51 GILK01008097.1:22-2457(+)
MDTAPFEAEHFDLKQWVNDTLRAPRRAGETIDKHLSASTMRLLLLSQELQDSIQQSSEQLVTAVPRALREVEKVRMEAWDLRKRLSSTISHLSHVDDQSKHSLAWLQEVDTVRSRLETCKEILKEVDNFSKKTAELEVQLQRGQWLSVAEQVKTMQANFPAMEGLSELQDKKKKLGEFESKLKEALKPRTLDALRENDLDTLRDCLKVYERLDCSEDFKQLFFAAQKEVPFAVWETTSVRHIDEPLQQWLPLLQSKLLDSLRQQAHFCRELFPENASVLTQLLIQSMTSVSSPVHTKLITLEPDALLDVYRCTLSWCLELRQAVSELTENDWRSFVTVLLQPFESVQHGLVSVERSRLKTQLASIPKGSESSSASVLVAYLRDSIPVFYLTVEQSADRCIELTASVESMTWINAATDVFTDYINKWMLRLQWLRQKWTPPPHQSSRTFSEHSGRSPVIAFPKPVHPPPPPSTSSTAGTTSTGIPSGASSGTSNGTSSGISGSTTTTAAMTPPQPPAWQLVQKEISSFVFDWSHFHSALQLVHLCDVLTSRLKRLEQTVQTTVIQLYRRDIKTSRDHANVLVRDIRLAQDSAKAQRLKAMIDGWTQGSSQPLQETGSALNRLYLCAKDLVHDLVFAPILLRLKIIPFLPIWKEKSSSRDVSDSFSLAPQEYMTQIGDHLLTLVQQLEPLTAAGSPKTEEQSTEVPAGDSDVSSTSAGSSGEWLPTVAMAVMDGFLQQVMKIDALSEKGCSQLNVDLGYLVNVLSLAITPHEDLTSLQTYVTSSTDKLQELANSQPAVPPLLQHVMKVRLPSM